MFSHGINISREILAFDCSLLHNILQARPLFLCFSSYLELETTKTSTRAEERRKEAANCKVWTKNNQSTLLCSSPPPNLQLLERKAIYYDTFILFELYTMFGPLTLTQKNCYYLAVISNWCKPWKWEKTLLLGYIPITKTVLLACDYMPRYVRRHCYILQCRHNKLQLDNSSVFMTNNEQTFLWIVGYDCLFPWVLNEMLRFLTCYFMYVQGYVKGALPRRGHHPDQSPLLLRVKTSYYYYIHELYMYRKRHI